MKNYILTILVTVISTLAIAQPPTPGFCDPSTWDGTGEPTPDSYAFQCYTFSSPQGKYNYYAPFNNDPEVCTISIDPLEMAELNWDNIYGLKGKYGIRLAPWLQDSTLSAQVFETYWNIFNNWNGQFQTIDDPVFHFYEGNYKFNKFFVAAGTTVIIHEGANVEVVSELKMEYSSFLNVEGSLKLSGTGGNPCITNVDGTINGVITKTVPFHFDNVYDDINNVEVRFPFLPGLYDVDLNQVALDVQAACAVPMELGMDIPDVQISWWHNGETELDNMYGFAVKQHTYHGSPFYIPDEALVGHLADPYQLSPNGFIKIDSDGDGVQDDLYATTSKSGMYYNWDEGVSVIPVYTEDSYYATNLTELRDSWMAAGDIIEFTNPAVLTTTDLGSITRTPQHYNRPFVIGIKDVNPAVTDFSIDIQGRFDETSKSFLLRNKAFTGFANEVNYPGATATYLEYPSDYSNFYENTSNLNPPLDLLWDTWPYHVGGLGDSDLRGLDMSGFSIINNTTGNFLNTNLMLLDIYYQSGGNSQLGLYDATPLMAYQNDRVFSPLSSNLIDTILLSENQSNYALPRPIFNLMIFDEQAPAYPGLEAVDILGIPGMEVMGALGDSLRPDDFVALNLQNPVDPSELNGVGFTTHTNQYEYPAEWYHINGQPVAGGFSPFDTVYADEPTPFPYEMQGQSYRNNKVNLKSLTTGRTPTGAGNVDPYQGVTFADYSIEELNSFNEFTLIRLAAITTDDDTLTLSVLPISVNPQYSHEGLDVIETTLAPDPAFYFESPLDNHIAARAWGGYARGLGDPLDTITAVFNAGNLEFDLVGLNIAKYILDSPVTQQSNCGLLNKRLMAQIDGTTAIGSVEAANWELELNPAWLEIPLPPGSLFPHERLTGVRINFFYSPLGGDVNLDGCVSASDLLVLLGFFGEDLPPGAPPVDLNCDGQVTTSDLLILLSSFGLCLDDVTSEAEAPELQTERGQFYSDARETTFPAFDIIDDYDGFTATQRAYLQSVNVPADIYVFDDMGFLLGYSRSIPVGPYFTDEPKLQVKLRDGLPDSDELLTTTAVFNSGIPDYDTPAYRIHVVFDQKINMPGFSHPMLDMCLGCTEIPNNPFNTRPQFIAN